jgi:rhodanese-related sulfurtransferase
MIKTISLTVALSLVAFACAKEDKADTDKNPHNVSGVSKLSVDEVDKLLTEKVIHAFDANGDRTRKEYGTLPGAKLLTSYRDYDTGILPAAKDAKLLFYCSNLQCSAAGKGAERAVTAGYTDVNVMPVGIRGWVDAGKNVTRIN